MKTTECTCNVDGSVNNICDSTTGECQCNENIIGDICDEVADGWWNFPTPTGMSKIFDIFLSMLAF